MKIYEFNQLGITLNGADGSLTSRSGDAIELRPQSREVLRLLANSPNKIVSKEDFTEAVWGGRVVGEDSLVQCIAEIRSAIGDTDRKIVQTVPRKGYRFVPPLATHAPAARVSHGKLALAVVGLALVIFLGASILANRTADERSPVVAVLPLDDLSAEPHQGYLSDALSEGIITELARFPQFQVVARNSSFQFRDRPEDVRDIGDVLGAGYVVGGSQQFDGANIKVTVHLADTDTGVHLFVDEYERQLDELFVVQNEIVRHVASVVGQSILDDMPLRVAPKDVDSRLRGLQARRFMTQLSYENWQKALALEETSIREEPDSAWGHIGKSLMLGTAAALGWREPRGAVLQEATEHAETALRLDPQNYMSHYTLARVLSRRDALDESILHFQRAAELNPSDSIIWIGMSVPLLYNGETERAIEVLDRAARVDPLHGDWLRWQQGLAYWQKGDCEKGLAAMQSMSSPPASSNRALAALLICLDRVEEARAALSKYIEARPGYSLTNEAATLPARWKPEGTAERWIAALRTAGLE